MKKTLFLRIMAVTLLLYFSRCNSAPSVDNSAIKSDSATIAAGEASFNRYCSGCHNFRQDGIGPQLSGVTANISADWILHFIKDPGSVISSGDKEAVALLKKYKTMMPSFSSLKDDELQSIISFLHIHKVKGQQPLSKRDDKSLSNPIPAPIRLSDLVVNLKEIIQVPPSVDSGKLPLTRITKLGFQPGAEGLFIIDLRGKLYKFQHNKLSVYMDMAKLKTKFIHETGLGTGFGSYAFHPGFAKNGFVYTTHTEPAGSAKADFGFADTIKVALQWVVTEWKAKNPGEAIFSGTGRELFRLI